MSRGCSSSKQMGASTARDGKGNDNMPTYTVIVSMAASMRQRRLKITRVHRETTGAPTCFAQVIFNDISPGNYFVGGAPLQDQQACRNVRGKRTGSDQGDCDRSPDAARRLTVEALVGISAFFLRVSGRIPDRRAVCPAAISLPRRSRPRASICGGHIIDIYDGCLNVADYICGRRRFAERRM
jgi:phenylpyruvate tautomerase PptA (4-oxalocrotonate tautomerase family)